MPGSGEQTHRTGKNGTGKAVPAPRGRGQPGTSVRVTLHMWVLSPGLIYQHSGMIRKAGVVLGKRDSRSRVRAPRAVYTLPPAKLRQLHPDWGDGRGLAEVARVQPAVAGHLRMQLGIQEQAGAAQTWFKPGSSWGLWQGGEDSRLGRREDRLPLLLLQQTHLPLRWWGDLRRISAPSIPGSQTRCHAPSCSPRRW